MRYSITGKVCPNFSKNSGPRLQPPLVFPNTLHIKGFNNSLHVFSLFLSKFTFSPWLDTPSSLFLQYPPLFPPPGSFLFILLYNEVNLGKGILCIFYLAKSVALVGSGSCWRNIWRIVKIKNCRLK